MSWSSVSSSSSRSEGLGGAVKGGGLVVGRIGCLRVGRVRGGRARCAFRFARGDSSIMKLRGTSSSSSDELREAECLACGGRVDGPKATRRDWRRGIDASRFGCSSSESVASRPSCSSSSAAGASALLWALRNLESECCANGLLMGHTWGRGGLQSASLSHHSWWLPRRRLSKQWPPCRASYS